MVGLSENETKQVCLDLPLVPQGSLRFQEHEFVVFFVARRFFYSSGRLAVAHKPMNVLIVGPGDDTCRYLCEE